jgi:hypothetical protein
MLGIGLVALEPFILFLNSLPLISFLGGAGPIRVFELSHAAHWPVNILYRALVVPPGMTYAIPGFLWWLLLTLTRPAAESAATSSSTDAPAVAPTGAPRFTGVVANVREWVSRARRFASR